MKNNKTLKQIKELIKTICKTCKSYEETIEALKPYLTNITNENSPRFEELNEKYNVLDIANSKSKKGLILDYEDTTKLVTNYYLYYKVPNGVVVCLNLFEKWKDDYLQKDIDLFIKEN